MVSVDTWQGKLEPMGPLLAALRYVPQVPIEEGRGGWHRGAWANDIMFEVLGQVVSTASYRDSQEAPKSDARSCVEYHVANGESEMVVRASKPISSDPSRMIELLANYGLPYWIAHVVKYHRQIGHETDMAPPITNPPCQ
ncbi:hypothetical protein EMCRGX_G003819 [Ephydatia muelleri]